MEKHDVRDHLGKKPVCRICGNEFMDDSNLGKHLKKIHGMNMRKLKAIELEKQARQKKQGIS